MFSGLVRGSALMQNLRRAKGHRSGRSGFCCEPDWRAVIRITSWCVFAQEKKINGSGGSRGKRVSIRKATVTKPGKIGCIIDFLLVETLHLLSTAVLLATASSDENHIRR